MYLKGKTANNDMIKIKIKSNDSDNGIRLFSLTMIDIILKTLYDCDVLTFRISKNIKVKLNACVCPQLRGHYFYLDFSLYTNL